MTEAALREAQRELALVAPAEFTARRKQLVERARATGDAARAAAIGAIRKPTQSAWVVNLVAHERRTELEAYIDLGRVLRARLTDLTAEELRTVNTDRVAYVRELVAEARSLAAERGVRLSNAHASEAEQTLAAAFSDDAAAEAVLSGTLTTGLQYAGLGFGGEVTTPRAGRSHAAPEPAAPQRAARPSRDEVAGVARRRAALTAAARAVDEAQQRLEHLVAEVQETEQDLAAAQLRVAAAERDLQHATTEEQRAEQVVESAVAAVEAGEARLAELQAHLSELEHDGRSQRP